MRLTPLILALVHGGVAVATPVQLSQTIDLPIVVEGKTVGSVKLPAGSEVEVISNDGTKAVIKRGGTQYSIAALSLQLPAAALANPNPTSRPTAAEAPQGTLGTSPHPALEAPPIHTPSPTPIPRTETTPAHTPKASGPWVMADQTTHSVSAPGLQNSQAAAAPTAAEAPKTVAEKLNAVLGLPIFSSKDLLEESPGEVAARLGIPEESRTSYETSFRKYTTQGETTLGGCRVFSTFVTGKAGKLTEVSFLLANKGDLTTFAQKSNELIAVQAYQTEIRKDQLAIREALDKVLGPYQPTTLGGNNLLSAERGARWNLGNVGLFLTTDNTDYCVLRVLPSSLFDDSAADRKSFAATRDEIPKRILRKPNGDVYLEMPMINQGPKGYCVVATLARLLRYYGLRGDMDLLARAAQTSAKNGTDEPGALNAVYGPLLNAGAHVSKSVAVNIGSVKSHIDRGQPIIWLMVVTKDLMTRVNQRREPRKSFTDEAAWRKTILSGRANTCKLGVVDPITSGRHCAMIIGYNEKTGEVAISNSWGEKYAVDWITVEEAAQSTQPNGAMVVEY